MKKFTTICIDAVMFPFKVTWAALGKLDIALSSMIKGDFKKAVEQFE